jgi:hypothetical protein
MERMEKQLTAVQWLLENLISEPYSEKDFEHNKNCWNKAEEMEKEQIIDAYDCGIYDSGENVSHYNMNAEQYYNETFKSE